MTQPPDQTPPACLQRPAHDPARTQKRAASRPALVRVDRLRQRTAFCPQALRRTPGMATALRGLGARLQPLAPAPQEFGAVVQVAVEHCRGRPPIIAGAGAGGGTTLAIGYAQEAERLGAQGILLRPHYLTEASQEGLVAHVQAVCRSVQIGVIVYNRGACRLSAASLMVLAERCPNLVGFKDGI